MEKNENVEIVYVLQNGDTNQYKIGITKDLGRRYKTLQTGCPDELKIVKIWIHTQRKQIEKYERVLHNYFTKLGQRLRPNGEWFKLTPKDIEMLCKPSGTKEQNILIENLLKTIDKD